MLEKMAFPTSIKNRMAHTTGDHEGQEEYVDYDRDNKITSEHLSDTITQTPNLRRREAPPLVQALSPEHRSQAERHLVRKIDARLLPMVILMYIMNYLDRNNIAAARLAGLETELRLTSTQYETCVSILFVGYVLMQIPSNLFLNKIGKPGLYLPTVMIVWGAISGATGGVKSYGGLVAIRFMLGFVEAAYFPGCLFFLSSWYTRKELAFRTSLVSICLADKMDVVEFPFFSSIPVRCFQVHSQA